MPSAVKPVIYQIVVRYFGNTNTTNRRDGTLAENGCGKFADVNDAALQAIKQLGATHVWLTGCQRQATGTDYSAMGLPADDADVIKGRAGSLYAIRDYFDVCPDYAVDPANRLAEFQALVDRVHAQGMKALIDFVPNHVARGYHSPSHAQLDFGAGDDGAKFFDRNNHFFYLVDPPGQRLELSRPDFWSPEGLSFDGLYAPEDGAAGRVPKVSGDNCLSPRPTKDNWYETAKLNYGYDFTSGAGHYDPRPRTWDAMDQILAFWQAKGVDGFRCDMAHLVPPEAWRFLIDNARAAERDPDCFFLAEAYPAARPWAPIDRPVDLIGVGFSAVYHSPSYDAVKQIYQQVAPLEAYDRVVTELPSGERGYWLAYLENHDERRIASPIEPAASKGDSGFGSRDAGYQLAPLQYLWGSGPVLFFNGQEVGEPGAGWEGFSSDDGRTTTFDYWAMPEFVKWVRGRAYDGGGLSSEQTALRTFYTALLKLCQHPCVRASGYWGLKYFNRASRFADCPDDLYSFARYEEGAGKLLLVVANFHGAQQSGVMRIPGELSLDANFGRNVTVRLLLDRRGAQESIVVETTAAGLAAEGFSVTLENQSASVYLIE